jgi:predicted HNH restriction endonuclease
MFIPKDSRNNACSKKCRRVSQLKIVSNIYYRNKKAWQEIIKAEGLGVCRRCGYDRHFGAIDFHHPAGDRNGEKNKTAAYLISQKPTPERIEKLKSFMPLCATCHREHHIEENTLGTFSKNK